jgi:hypothetical protein
MCEGYFYVDKGVATTFSRKEFGIFLGAPKFSVVTLT